MSAITDALDTLQSKVESQSSVIRSAETLLTDLASQLRANASSPQRINEMADAIDAKTAELAAAVEANTV